MSGFRQSDQRGMVSFMVTLIMMIVISLIVIGFAQVSNRNRREALDRQLSMQAFYAAESGINDAVTKIQSALLTGSPVTQQTSCTDTTYQASSIVTDGSVGYTCILVNTNVASISTNAGTQRSAVVPINMVDKDGNPQTAGSLSFSWSPPDGLASTGTTGCQSAGTFPLNDSTYGCTFGLLRVDIFKSQGVSMSATAFADNTMTFYLQPINGSPPGTYNLGGFGGALKAAIVSARYDAGTSMYTAKINFSGGAQAQNYYVRISTLYRDAARVLVDGTNAAGVNSNFADAQALVDVTGKAQDVLRRVQVTVPLQRYDGSLVPSGGVQSSTDVCKRFAIYPGNYFPDAPGCGP